MKVSLNQRNHSAQSSMRGRRSVNFLISLKKLNFHLHFKAKPFNILFVVEGNQLPIDFRHLETFCRVAQLKSFTKAAGDLCLSQPTVSGHILTLEQSLSLRLFDRTGREALLTKAGEVFFRHATKILSFRQEALNALSEFSQGIRGNLSLGASTIPGEYLLPKLIGDFKKEHPRTMVSLKISDSKEIIHNVLEGHVEFGMTGARLNHRLLHYDLFEQDEIIVIGPPEETMRQKQRIGFQEIFEKPWILREDGSGTQMAAEKAFRKEGRSLRDLNVVMEMGSTASVKEGVKARLGLAFASRRAVEDELRLGLLCQIEVTGIKPIFRRMYIVTHRGRTLSPVGTQFLRFLKKRMGENAN
jgi:DNA-binding transcriptional LysR family regulator